METILYNYPDLKSSRVINAPLIPTYIHMFFASNKYNALLVVCTAIQITTYVCNWKAVVLFYFFPVRNINK